MLVSFIIPAYNAADTIERCLESICNLTIKKEDYEIIVIDDCSTDETVLIIEVWRLKIENLILLKQSENMRQGAARNRGVKVAKGEYICFVDADDAVTEGIVNTIRVAKDKQTDMTAYHCASANEHGKIIREKEHLSYREGELFSGIDLQNRHPYWFSGPVAYIYSRAFLSEVNYPFAEGVLYEDSDYVAVHLYYAKRMAYSRELGYLVYEREGSTTHSMTHKNLADYLLLGVRMLRFYESIVKSEELMVNNEKQKFAESILEGACYNMSKSCKRIIKLPSVNELRSFYARVDERVNRKELLDNIFVKKYNWNIWNSICIGHKHITMICFTIVRPLYKFYQHIR